MSSRLRKSETLRVADLAAFCAVAERRSFVEAARALGTTPSTVTRAVQAVESLIGQELVSRTRRFTSLTPAGEAYYETVHVALRHLKQGADVLARGVTQVNGWVRFSAPTILETHLLPQILRELTLIHSNLKLDITYTDELVDPSQAGLDFAIRGAFPLDSNLIGQTLWTYDRYLCAGKAYVRDHGLAMEPTDLSSHRIIMHTGPRILKGWYLQNGKKAVRINIQPSHRVNTGAALLTLAQQGLGIARLAGWVAQPLIDSGQLVRVCPDYVVNSSTGRRAEMHAVYRGSTSSIRVKSILRTIKKLAAKSLADH
jgi:DNA-binding transcriptional LysR family regulator